MMRFYEFFRYFHWEWVLYTGILALGLHHCFLPEGKKRWRALFVPGSIAGSALLMPTINYIPYKPIFDSQGSVIWAFYLLFLVNLYFWLALCFPTRRRSGLGYSMYCLLFIILVKTALIPLYTAESTMRHDLYALFDMATIAGLAVALFFLTNYLFVRYPVQLERHDAPGYHSMFFLMPVSIIFIFALFVSGYSFFLVNIQPILAGVLALLVPLFYCTYAVGSQAFKERQELKMALLSTRASLEHYRGMIELEDRIRKEKHELKNRYLHIQILLRQGRIPELETYLSEEIGSRMDSLSEVLTGNVLVDYILKLKKEEAEKAKISFSISVSLERESPVKDELFCTILLNLLNNAIEACALEPEPEILVILRNRGAYLILQVKNRISRNVLMVNPGLLTTKKDKTLHGHGISVVRSAVREASGLLEIRTDNGYFDVTVALPQEGLPASPGQGEKDE